MSSNIDSPHLPPSIEYHTLSGLSELANAEHIHASRLLVHTTATQRSVDIAETEAAGPGEGSTTGAKKRKPEGDGASTQDKRAKREGEENTGTVATTGSSSFQGYRDPRTPIPSPPSSPTPSDRWLETSPSRPLVDFPSPSGSLLSRTPIAPLSTAVHTISDLVQDQEGVVRYMKKLAVSSVPSRPSPATLIDIKPVIRLDTWKPTTTTTINPLIPTPPRSLPPDRPKLERDLDALVHSNRDLRRDADQYKTEINNLKRKLQHTDGPDNTFRELEMCRRAKAEAERKVANQKTSINALQRALARKHADLEQAIKQISTLRASGTSNSDLLKKEVVALRARERWLTTDKELLEARLKVAEDVRKKLENELRRVSKSREPPLTASKRIK